MKNPLPHSEPLAKFFAPRREETPMLSAPEIEKLLDRSDMLHNHPTTPALKKWRNLHKRTIMSLSGISILAVAGYFAFFNGQPRHAQGTKGRIGTQVQSLETFRSLPSMKAATAPEPQNRFLYEKPARSTASAAAKPASRGPWSAGNDQIYADLTPKELAKLGIVVSREDTVNYYDLESLVTSQSNSNEEKTPLFGPAGVETQDDSSAKREEHYQRMTLTSNLNSLQRIERSAIPGGVRAPRFFPVLITTGGGASCMYRYHEGNVSGFGSLSDAEQEISGWHKWLSKPAIPGLHAFAYNTTIVTTSPCEGCTATELDTITIRIGKDLPLRPFPKSPTHFASMDSAQVNAFGQLMHYYEGTAQKPSVEWPKNLTIKVDTITAQRFREELDAQENTSAIRKGRAIFSRLNELVPVIVRHRNSSGAPDSGDYIFWYEPSDELFNALPPAQAALFRAKLAEPPHCFTAPNAVMTRAEITYCVPSNQGVWISVSDLTGRELMRWSSQAVAGDNIVKFSTETLQSGMYLVTVKAADGSERTRRIWVENAHPKSEEENVDEQFNRSLRDGKNAMIVLNANGRKDFRIGLPSIPILALSDDELSALGIDNQSFMARFHERSPWNSAKVLDIGVERNGRVQVQVVDSMNVHEPVPEFRPQYVTDGLGTERAVIGDSGIAIFAVQKFDPSILVPILLRTDTTRDSLNSNDLIFWYAPTKNFLAALPPAEAAIYQTKLNEPGQCMSVINESSTKAAVNYCVTVSQVVQLSVTDLIGTPLFKWDENASAGDNIAHFPTATLQSGMYLIKIQTQDDSTRVERLWVDNPNPVSDTATTEVASIVSYVRDTTWFNSHFSIQIGIPAIHIIRLEPEDTKELGIVSTDEAVNLYTSGIGDSTRLWRLFRQGGGDIEEARTFDTSVRVSQLKPTIVTDGLGLKRMWIFRKRIASLKAKFDTGPDRIDSLIPILFPESENTDSIGPRDLIFWYQPTPEFLAALPDSARQIAEQMIGGTGNTNAVVAQEHGAIENAIAFPNPSSGRFTLKLSLRGERNLTFTLRNLLGQAVAPPVEAHVSGDSQQPLDFGSVGEGVYLLDITSDKGERYLERIVIAR